MRKCIYKILLIIFLIVTFLLLLEIKSHAAVSLSITPSTKEIEPGKSFSVIVKVSGGAGYVNLSATNATLNSSKVWVDDSSTTISGTAGNTNGATISISAKGTIGDYNTEKDVSKSASTSIKINKKEQTAPTTTKTPTTTTKPSTTTKPAATTTKAEEPKVEEPKVDDFYISNISLKGIKEDGEKIDITLSPKFSKDVYEYTCNVSADIKKIEVEKDAKNYTDNVIVTNLEELKEGENIITLLLAKEDYESKTYKIKVIKEEQEILETSATIEENEEKVTNKETKMISMPVWIFVIMQLAIIIVEVLVIKFILWKNIFRRKKY